MSDPRRLITLLASSIALIFFTYFDRSCIMKMVPRCHTVKRLRLTLMLVRGKMIDDLDFEVWIEVLIGNVMRSGFTFIKARRVENCYTDAWLPLTEDFLPGWMRGGSVIVCTNETFICSSHSVGMSRFSKVGIATGYLQEDRRVRVRVWVESKIFSSRPDRLWGLPGVKWLGREAVNSPPTSTEIKKTTVPTATFSYVFMA